MCNTLYGRNGRLTIVECDCDIARATIGGKARSTKHDINAYTHVTSGQIRYGTSLFGREIFFVYTGLDSGCARISLDDRNYLPLLYPYYLSNVKQGQIILMNVKTHPL